MAILIILISTVIVNASKSVDVKRRIVLSTQKNKNTPAGMYLNMLYSEAFKRLGMTFVFETYPAKRSSLMSDTGKVDGELSRIYSYSEVHPNVIRVEQPHWTSGFIAVVTNPSIHLDGWKSLKKIDYVVNYIRGIKGCEVNLPKVVKPEKLDVVNSVASGYEKLLRGWADVFIGSEMDFISLLESDKYRNSQLRIVGVMEKFTGHAFLHKKNKELASKLSEVLRKMKKEGLFEKYRKMSKLKGYFKD